MIPVFCQDGFGPPTLPFCPCHRLMYYSTFSDYPRRVYTPSPVPPELNAGFDEATKSRINGTLNNLKGNCMKTNAHLNFKRTLTKMTSDCPFALSGL